MKRHFIQLNMDTLIFFLLSWLFICVPLSLAHAKTEEFVLTSGVSAMRESPYLNFSQAEFLSVFGERFPFGRAHAYLGFDLSSIPDNAKILSATLKLYVSNSESMAGPVLVYPVVEQWKETALAWGATPWHSTEQKAELPVGNEKDTWKEVVVTDLLRWMFGEKNVLGGFVLVAPEGGSGGMTIDWKNNNKIHAPVLRVEFLEKEKRNILTGDNSYLSAIIRPILSLKHFLDSDDSSGTVHGQEGSSQSEYLGSLNVVEAKRFIKEHSFTVLISAIIALLIYTFWRKEGAEREDALPD
jgi:hypothetical protein